MFTISVVGPLAVTRSGALITIPAGKTSEILVRLALEAGRPVRADRLVDDLWGDDAVRTSRNTLQAKVAKLRRALGDASAVVAVDGGYVLAVEPEDVDALAVGGHAAEAARLLDGGDERAAAEVSASTLQRYAGELLPGAGDGEWVEPHRARLAATRLQLLETNLAARLRLGAGGELIGELEAAVDEHPYQEVLWVLLITALYRSGRQADALAAYQRVRQRLADDLGLVPGPQLQQVEQAVLLQDPLLMIEAASGTPSRAAASPSSTSPAAGNLPSLAIELIGRDAVLAHLAERLGRDRLVELVGAGGIGKTAVALAAGRALAASPAAPRGGVWLVRLESAVTAADVGDALLTALQVIGGEAALVERLKSVATVLLLDNCEHVVEAAADAAVRLLDAAPQLTILCTSQVPLGVDGEVLVELEPLALDDAVALFTRRATAPRGAAPGDGTAAAVEDLCRSLDGLPLAIELAAARTRTLSVAEITRRLDNRFNVLSDPTSRRPERRRALKATIGWSYELLFPDDQRGLWALATFAGGASLAAVEHVLETLDVPASAAIDVVGRLANRSLVIVDDEVGSPTVRYRLLDSIRAFALDAMAEHGLTATAHAAHAGWYAALADESTAGVRGGRQAEHLARARTERANIDAALAWCLTEAPLLGLRIVNGFGWAWIVLGDSRGAQRIHAALDAAGAAAPPADRANALLLAGWMEASAGHIDLAQGHVLAAAELADVIVDADLQAGASYFLAYVVSHRGEFRFGIELTDRCRARYAAAGLERPWHEAANWLFTARAAISAGDVPRSEEAVAQVDRWLSIVDDPWLHVRRDAARGELARLQHRFGDAVTHIERAAATSRQRGFLQTEAYQTSLLGRALSQAGDHDRGALVLEAAIDKAESIGDPRLAALARVHLGRVVRGSGRVDDARRALAAASAWHRSAGGGETAALGDCLLAALDQDAGVAGAGERVTEILAAATARGDAPVEVFAHDALARAAAASGDSDAARAHLAHADERMDAASHFITEHDRCDARVARDRLHQARVP